MDQLVANGFWKAVTSVTSAEPLEMIPQLLIWFNASPGSVAGIVKASCFTPRVMDLGCSCIPKIKCG